MTRNANQPANPLAMSALQPERLSESRSQAGLRQELRVPLDLPCVDGHFPGFGVVPGVVQLAWAIDAAAGLMRQAPEIGQISALKFGTLLRPGQVFTLSVDLVAAGGFRFRLDAGDRVFSSGRCIAGPPTLS